MTYHTFDQLSSFCTQCGCSRQQMREGQAPILCNATDNVIAISHVIAHKRLMQAFAAEVIPLRPVR